MRYLRTYNESIFNDIQTYTGGSRRPALTADIMKSIDDIHSGFTRQDIIDMFQEISDEGIGEVGKVDFFYGIDSNRSKDGERWYGFSQIKVEIIIDDESKKDEYFKIREVIFSRMKDMYNYTPGIYSFHFKELNPDQPANLEIGEEISFRSSKIYWITPRSQNESAKTPLSEIKLDIQNILLDINDEGILTDINELSSESLEIHLHKNSGVILSALDIIKWEDIKDVIERIDKYMSVTSGWRATYYLDSFGVVFDNGVLRYGAMLPKGRGYKIHDLDPLSSNSSCLRFEVHIY